MTLLAGLITPTAGLAQTPVPTSATPVATPSPTPIDPDQAALATSVTAILNDMSVADRVGQLFMVGFQGGSAGYESDIAELIYGYRVGGVILSPENGNFTNERGVDTPRQVATLVNRLQAMAYGLLLPADSALEPLDESVWPPAGAVSMEQVTNVPPVNLPLFIAVEQSGDGLPATALRRGFTPLPSPMALGATWNPELVNRVGQIVGRELASVGVNMLLGPNLDVLSQPRTDGVGSLGLYTFGGDPYWVTQMGRAYIAGVHAGGDGHVATVARHFPGAGDADRLPDQEVATVQRSLQELERVTLPPFQAVTRSPSSILADGGDPAATEAMMSSHIRYTGLQGASLGRNTPISLAPELEAVLAREGFNEWRRQGGLMVSNVLGAPAIRRYYDPTLEEFPYRRVAMDAFTAGHDLLLLDRFSLDDQWENEKHNIEETISFFQERYVRDPDFAAQVDDSVRRILTLKLRLYADAPSTTLPDMPPIPLSSVLVNESALEVLQGDARASALVTVGQVARESFTVLYPDPSSASEMVSMVPQANEQLLIVAPARAQRECPSCPTEIVVPPEELVEIIERLYGPNGTGQLVPGQISSLTFDELAALMALDEAEPGVSPTTPMTETATVPDTTTAPGTTTVPDTTAVTGTGALTAPNALTVTAPVTTAPAPDEGRAAEATDAIPTASPGVTTTESSEAVSVTASPQATVTTSDVVTGSVAQTQALVDAADWIIFAMLDISDSHPNSDVVRQFLNSRGAQLADKRIIVLALQAPYFLDATEISKLNGYYGVYSKTPPSMDSAIRALFRAYTPTGAPPVPVAGTRFATLDERLAPDPSRPIAIQVLNGGGELLIGEAAEQNAALPVVEHGTLVRVLAGPIYDRNGKPVRNGTPVDITITYDEDGISDTETVGTQSGVAVRDVVLNRGGMVRISAQAGEAVSEEPVGLSVQNVPPTADAAVTTSAATTETAAITVTPAVTVADPAVADPGDEGGVSFVTLIVALVAMLATLGFLLVVQVRVLPRATLVNNLLWAVNCGLVAYILYGLGLLPGGSWLQNSLRVWGAAVVVFIAMLLPLVWLQLRTSE